MPGTGTAPMSPSADMNATHHSNLRMLIQSAGGSNPVNGNARQSWSAGGKSHIFSTTQFPAKYTTMRPHTEPGYTCRIAKLPSLGAAGAPSVPVQHKSDEWHGENLAQMVASHLPEKVVYPQHNKADPRGAEKIPINLIPSYPYRFEVVSRNPGPFPRKHRAARRTDGSSTTPFFVDVHWKDDDVVAPRNRMSASFCPPSRATHRGYHTNSSQGMYGYTRGSLRHGLGFAGRITADGIALSPQQARTFSNGRFYDTF